jgi:hypothetical protein
MIKFDFNHYDKPLGRKNIYDIESYSGKSIETL